MYLAVISADMKFSDIFSEEEQMLIEQYASVRGRTVPDVIRKATMEMVEDDLDAEACRIALSGYEKGGRTYSHDEIKKEFGLR